jgi:hypothetical protein
MFTVRCPSQRNWIAVQLGDKPRLDGDRSVSLLVKELINQLGRTDTLQCDGDADVLMKFCLLARCSNRCGAQRLTQVITDYHRAR